VRPNEKKSSAVRSLLFLLCAGASIAGLAAACGPKCTEVKSALAPESVTGEDVGRVNKLVAKRKDAIAEAEKGEQAQTGLEKLKFSVTAYELAIEAQLRVIKISPKFEDSPLYSENRALFDEMRCYFDGLVADGTGHVVSDRVGRDIQQWSQKVGSILKSHGRLSDSELRDYFEEGIQSSGKGEE
jgi:hypothetical protein